MYQQMPAELETQAEHIANGLNDRYGATARLQAAICACQAIDEHDLEACQLWRKVLDLLDVREAGTMTRN